MNSSNIRMYVVDSGSHFQSVDPPPGRFVSCEPSTAGSFAVPSRATISPAVVPIVRPRFVLAVAALARSLRLFEGITGVEVAPVATTCPN